MIKNFMEYKSKPLARQGNVIYYGYMDNEVVAMLTIKSSKEVEGISIPTSVQIQLIVTDPNVPPQEMVKKHTVKDDIYEALDMAYVWIDRYKKKKRNNREA